MRAARISRLGAAILAAFVTALPGDGTRAQGPLLVDASADAGLDVTHVNGMAGELFFVEMMGAGVALFDADNDGDLDLFAAQGHRLSADVTSEAPALPVRDRLLRNDLDVRADGSRTLRFSDVTAASRIEARRLGYGMGVATGDFDGDGRVDLYVTNWGPNVLWRNREDGIFEDVTKRAGVGDEGWGTSAAFLDYDGDGDLDLYVANYVDYSYESDKPCSARSGAPDYCGPLTYEPAPDRLYRNRGDGTFAPVPLELGGAPPGAGLGVISGDFNDDGRLDIFVANDQSENHLWLSRADGSVYNDAVLSGVAVNLAGKPEASMGVAAGDFDNDGDEDLLVSHLSIETNTLYRNAGSGAYDDVTAATGLGVASYPFTGFGLGWFDLDADTLLDLFVANGAVKIIPSQRDAGDALPLRQRNQLFRNLGNGEFQEIGARAAPALDLEEVSRGVALGDIDNDGDTDIVVSNNNGMLRLFLNEAPRRSRHWIGLDLLGDRVARPMLGARVVVELSSGASILRRSRSDGSYCSAHDPRVLVAVPDDDRVAGVVVHWPGGRAERFPPPPLDRYFVLRKGTGTEIQR